jgi:hypothetical protein
MNPFFKAAEEAGTVMKFKRDIDWVGTTIQAVCCVAIGFAIGWWWSLALACVWLWINRKKNGG